jgi:hypothetical protein
VSYKQVQTPQALATSFEEERTHNEQLSIISLIANVDSSKSFVHDLLTHQVDKVIYLDIESNELTNRAESLFVCEIKLVSFTCIEFSFNE